MANEFPGQALAEQAGYTLHSYAGNRMSANYVKETPWGCLHLTVCHETRFGVTLETLRGKLMATWKLVQITTGDFQWPHPKLAMFENQVMAVLENLPREQISAATD